MDTDTSMGGASGRFPQTQHSAIVALQSDDSGQRSRGYETVIAAYWKPAYKYIRIKWNASNEDAKDLVQGFFARAIEKEFFRGYDPAKGSFRTYLRICLDRFVANQKKSAGRIKRGVGTLPVSLDFAIADTEVQLHEPAAGESIEDYFQREWVRDLFALAVERLRQDCTERARTLHWRLFERYDLDGDETRPTYQQMSEEFGLATTDVTNYLAAVRRDFREIVLAKIRELTASEQEFRSEVEAVLGLRFDSSSW